MLSPAKNSLVQGLVQGFLPIYSSHSLDICAHIEEVDVMLMILVLQQLTCIKDFLGLIRRASQITAKRLYKVYFYHRS